MNALIIRGSIRIKFLVLCLSLFVFFTVGYLIRTNGVSTESLSYSMYRLILSVLLAVVMISVFKTTRVTNLTIGFKYPTRSWLIILGLFYMLVLVSGGLLVNVSNVVRHESLLFRILFMALSAGIFEETICRGLLFSLALDYFQKTAHPLVWAGISNSMVFGLLHFSNIFTNHQSVAITIQQVFYAFVMGVGFSAIRVATNGLSLGIILHSLIDFQPTIGQPLNQANSWLGLLIVFGPFLVVAIVYLFKAERLIDFN